MQHVEDQGKVQERHAWSTPREKPCPSLANNSILHLTAQYRPACIHTCYDIIVRCGYYLPCLGTIAIVSRSTRSIKGAQLVPLGRRGNSAEVRLRPLLAESRRAAHKHKFWAGNATC